MEDINLHIFKDLESLSLAALEKFLAVANQSIAARGRFLVALNGGGTPQRLFELLAAAPDKIDWTRAHAFWGDERLVPASDPGNNYALAKQTLFDHVSIPAENIHRVNTDLSTGSGQRLDPAEAVADYCLLLKRFAAPPFAWPRFDLVLLGMGDDGHTASLFPGSPVDASAPVVAVTANYQGRPANRITLTPPVFNSAREIFFLVCGASKADALSHVLNRGSEARFPAARIRPNDGTVHWFVDEAAAGKL